MCLSMRKIKGILKLLNFAVITKKYVGMLFKIAFEFIQMIVEMRLVRPFLTI